MRLTFLMTVGIAAVAALQLSTTVAQATPVTVSSTDAGSACTSGSNSLVSFSWPICSTPPVIHLAGEEGARPGLVIEAQPDVRFGFLSFDLIWSFPEVLSVALADLPVGTDPLTQAGYDAIWQANLWELTPEPNVTMTGFRNGIEVARTSFHISDTSAYAIANGLGNINDDPRVFQAPDFPIGPDFSDLDRLEIANAAQFDDALDFGAQIIGDRVYTCLGSCGDLVLDHVMLDASKTTTPPPAPIPLPPASALLVLALGLARLAGGPVTQRSCGTRGD